MAKIITMINIKGGVGKTTLCFNFAHALSDLDKKVLLVDMDFQYNLTSKAIKDPKEVNKTVADLMLKELQGDLDEPIITYIQDTHIPNVDIIPSELRLGNVRDSIDTNNNPIGLTILKKNLINIQEEYDYIFIDTHPNFDILTTLSLMTSDYYLIPVQPEMDSLRGIKYTKQYADNFKDMNPKLSNLGIILTNVDRRTVLAREIDRKLKNDYPEETFDNSIQVNVDITKAAMENKTVFEYDRTATGVKAIKDAVEELIKRCGDKIE